MKRTVIFLILSFVLIGRISICAENKRGFGHVYCRSSCDDKRIALTFDDGPHPRYTREILEILNEYQITATFFIIGVNAELYPDALREIVDAGCEIGNHTYSHAKLRRLNQKEIREEIQKCEDVLLKSVGIRPTVFRPPEGMCPPGFDETMCKMGYNIVLWSIDTMDWAMNPSNQIERLVMKQTKGGDIILMHDYVSGGNTTCNALRRMIPQLLSEGYEFVTVSQLIGR